MKIRHTDFSHEHVIGYRYTIKQMDGTDVRTLELRTDLGGKDWGSRPEGMSLVSAVTSYLEDQGFPAPRVDILPAY